MKLHNETGKKRLLILLMVLTTIPFLFAVNQPPSFELDQANLPILALYGSAVAGYIGVSLMLWQFILGTRSVTGLYFKDLPWTIRTHIKLGKWGTLLIFLHPILILYSYSESVLYALLPDLSNGFETGVTYGRVALIALLLVWLSSAVLRGKIAYRPWKYIHLLAYLSLPAALLHVPEVGSSFGNAAIQTYWYSFIAIFLLFIVLRVRHLFGFGKLRFNVLSNKKIAPDIYLIRMQPYDKSFRVRLGQYIYLQKNLKSEEHPFTAVESNSKTGEISVAYKVFGRYTKSLSTIKKGDSVLLDGPYGQFTQQLNLKPTLPTVFIAGGIGITPFASHIINGGSSSNHMLFYANQTKQSAVFRDLLKKKLGDRFVEIYAKEPASKEHGVETGRINAGIIKKYTVDPQKFHYFVCGPPAMMEAVKGQLRELGVPKSQIELEEFGF